MPTTHAVFVYGMLLPDAHDPATLDDHRLHFDMHATIKSGYDGEIVHGGVIYCDDDYLRYLDSIEGEGHYYDRVRVTVDTPSDEIEAWVYVMRTPGDRRPTAGYLSRIEEGYRKFGHPLDALYEAAHLPA